MEERKPIVITYRPGQAYWVLGAILVIIITVLFLGRYWGSKVFDKEMIEKVQLEVRTVDLEAQVLESNRNLGLIKLSAEVDAVALENTRQEMIVLQRQIYRRGEELKLYQDLLQDNNQPKGLSVSDLNMVAMDDGRFKYRWVARQKTVKMQTLSVYSDMWILGMQNGEAVSLSVDTLDDQVKKLPIKLEFKYFSINQGIIQLPEGFEPEQVRITLRYTWMKEAQSDQKFDWKIEE
ncbi:MAG: hypothetical protein QNK66_09320 [Porticoccaceae bacterium]|jgi:hypothetical protein|tara:strand:+ start:951 stop:1655 length:705 start_codon:yes stop_codon:yes gene_type:complete